MPDEPDATPTTALTHFTPVPRLKDRSNGWSPEVQRAFIEALADTGSVKSAARAVGRAPEGAYLLRRHPEGAEFAAAWAAALAHGVQRIEDVAMDRALNGVEVPVYSYGKLVGTRISYNDRLLMFMLRNRAPERFATGGAPRALNAVGRMEIERLKREWQAERDREEEEAEEDTPEALDRMLEDMRRNRLALLSPAQRRAQIAAEAQSRADRAAGWSPGAAYADYEAPAAEQLPHFIAEVESEWPPLEPWVWQGVADDEEEDEDDPTIQALPSPPPEDEPNTPPQGPRVRRLRDDNW
jgi:hypothetical protein